MRGSDGLTKSGPHTLIISGTNQITGPLTVNSGVVEFTNLAQLGADSSPIRIASGGLAGGGLTFTGTNTLAFTRGLAISGRAAASAANAGATLDISSVISGDGELTITGAGAVRLSGANTYRGSTRLFGLAAITSDAALGASANPVEFFTDGSLRLDGEWSTGRTITAETAGILDLNGHDSTWSGSLSGPLTVSGTGTLAWNGSAASSGALTISPAATLTGGVQTSSTVELGGTLAPGNGIGEMRLGDLRFNAGSKLALEIASPLEFDRLALTGSLGVVGNADLLLSLLYDPADGLDRFTIIENDGTDPVTFTGAARFLFGGTPLNEGQRFTSGGQEFQITYAGGDGNDVVLAATPEPSTLALLAGGALVCGRRRRGSRG